MRGDDPEREWLLKALRSMSRQTDRLARLVDDLLDTARIQSGRFDLTCKPVDLLPVVKRGARALRAARLGGTALRAASPPSGPLEGVWDAARLDQVITNLLSNAVRYSPQGGTVRISLQREPLAMWNCRCAIEGIGIPPESLTRLFHPFSRASNATSRHFGGLGLGLFICREIVERHGGTIWAESAGCAEGQLLPRPAAPRPCPRPPHRPGPLRRTGPVLHQAA